MAFTVTRLLALGIAALLALAAATPAAALPNLAARRRLTGLTQDPNVVLFDADQDGVGDTISVKDAGSNTYQYFAVRVGGLNGVGEAAAVPLGEALAPRSRLLGEAA